MLGGRNVAPMKAAVAKKPLVRIAALDDDPLRLVGLQVLFDSEPDLELMSASMPEVVMQQNLDLVLLGSRSCQDLLDVLASFKVTRPHLPIIVTGSGLDDETIFNVIAFGAKGYVHEAASPSDFVHAIRIVSQGSIWAPRHVLSRFIERASLASSGSLPTGRNVLTDREKEVLGMLVEGRTNKEIGSALGIEERTVKAHVSKLMRKIGAQNRIALSVHAISHSLVSPQTLNVPRCLTRA